MNQIRLQDSRLPLQIVEYNPSIPSMSGSPSLQGSRVLRRINGVRHNCLNAGSRAEGTDCGKTAVRYKASGNVAANPLRNVAITHGWRETEEHFCRYTCDMEKCLVCLYQHAVLLVSLLRYSPLTNHWRRSCGTRSGQARHNGGSSHEPPGMCSLPCGVRVAIC